MLERKRAERALETVVSCDTSSNFYSRSITMMRLKTGLVLAALLCGAGLAPAQTMVRVRTLSRPEATTLLPFGAVESVRAMNRGKVLVNDSTKRQLVLLDSTFGAFSVVLDSASTAGLRYGSTGAALVPYLADSTLFRDVSTQQYFVIDPSGEIASRFQKSIPGALGISTITPKGFDLDGNAIMPGLPPFNMRPSNETLMMSDKPILRANFAAQRYEQLTRIKAAPMQAMSFSSGADGTRRVKRTVNPLSIADDWMVLSDGTVAVVRVNDYRVEMFDANGKRLSSTKLSYEKRRLTDNDKRQLIDSAEAAFKQQLVDPASSENANAAFVAQLGSISRDSMQKMIKKGNGSFTVTPKSSNSPESEFSSVPLKEISDYLPPFQIGELRADLDANLWIATNNASDVSAGEIMYDVVNKEGTLTNRVRVPAGRTIVGFGHDGAIYLKYKKADHEWMLERVRFAN